MLRVEVEAHGVPVQKLPNLLEKIRDKKTRVAGRHYHFLARHEEIASWSTLAALPLTLGPPSKYSGNHLSGDCGLLYLDGSSDPV